jgi:hypothetical protein
MGRFAIDANVTKASKDFVNELLSKGYNAMIDDNDSGRYNEVHNPIYVFNGKQSLRKIETRKLSLKDILDYSKKAEKRIGRKLDYT